MASATLPPKLDMNDPNVRKLVYNMYRGMLGTYNNQANDIVDTMPRNIVTEDAGIYSQLEAMINSSQDGMRGGPPPPPPPPGMPGSMPSRRLQSEIPERGLEPPAAIQNAMMTKDKKPFTYTPGGLDLSEIKSPRMARRINRNAHAQEIHGQQAPQHAPPPAHAPQSPPQTQMPTQVFPSGPPPPPPPPSFPPPTISNPPSQPPPQLSQPRIRGFDPNEILKRGSRLQPEGGSGNSPSPQPNIIQRNEPGSIYVPPVRENSQLNEPGRIYVPPVQENYPREVNITPSQINEPGSIYVPPVQNISPRAQLGSIYIPPVPLQSPDNNSTPSSGSSHSYTVTSPPSAGATPWGGHRPSTSPSPAPQPGGARIIPIKIEGRESVESPRQQQDHYQSQQNQRTQQQQQYHQQLQQQQFQQQQQQQQGRSTPSGGGTRVIPIKIEGATSQSPSAQQFRSEGQNPRPANQQASPIQQQGRQQFVQKYDPTTPSSPTPYSAPNAQGRQQGAPQWAPVQPQGLRQQDQTDRGSFLPPLDGAGHPQGPPMEYGAYNTAGVPLSALKKMQLSDEDKALMEKLKAQVDDESYLHREADPRYRGAAIPSRAFRMLQTMTDTAGDGGQVPRGPPRGPVSRPQSATSYQQQPAEMSSGVPPSEQQAPEPRKYTGGSIPSRSFRMLQAMTGQDSGPARAGNSPNSATGRETPGGRWCPSPAPSPMDPYWGYYPPDPYMYYNYLSDLNAAYGYPPPPPPPPNYHPPPSNYPPPPNYPPPSPFLPQRFASYGSDNDENGYSSTDELGQYYANYRRNMGYHPYPVEPNYPVPVTPKPKQSPKAVEEVPKNNFKQTEVESEEDSTDESVSSSEEEETDTDDTEIEEGKDAKKVRKSAHKLNKQASLKAFKSVSDVNICTSESTATVTNDEWEDCASKLGDEDQEEVGSNDDEEDVEDEEELEDEEEEEEEDDNEEEESSEEEEVEPCLLEPEDQIPHQLSVIYEESEHSDFGSVRKANSMKSGTKSVTSDSEASTATLDNCLEEEEPDDESDDDNLVSESSVTVRLPLQLKFSRGGNEEITTVIVGDSEVQRVSSAENSEKSQTQPEENIRDKAESTLNEEKLPSPEPERKNLDDELRPMEEADEYKSDEADVSFTFSIPTRSNSVITVLSTEEESRSKSKVDVIQEEADGTAMDAEVTVSVCLPKKAKREIDNDQDDEKIEVKDFSSWIDKKNDDEKDCVKETEKTDGCDGQAAVEGSYEKSMGRLEDLISCLLENTKETVNGGLEKKKLNKKDSKDSVDESEEDDSGVTDMSTKPQNSETDENGDTESEFTELNKLTQYQRASTHSRLFKLLQDECEKEDDEDEEGDDTSKSEPITSPIPVDSESIASRKEKLTLPLGQNTPEAESLSSSSGVTSPSSPTVTDRLVKELIQSLLHKKKGKKFRKLPMAKLHAAALRILQEDMDPYDTSSASASGDDGFMMSPVRRTHSQGPVEPPPPLPPPPPQNFEQMPETIYGENYYDYLDYYNSWGPPSGYYNPPDYDIMPSRAFQYLNHPGGYSPGFKPKCPRVPLPGPHGFASSPVRGPTPTSPYQRSYEDVPELTLSFTDKRDRVSKVLDKSGPDASDL